MEIQAAVARNKAENFVVESLEMDMPRDNEVLVKIVAAGICHTDLSVRDQHIPVPFPVVLGHEGAGIVERIGKGITTVKPGDKVVLSLGSCGVCEKCLIGLPSYCERHVELNFAGSRPDGSTCLHSNGETVHSHFFCQSSFGTYSIVDETSLIKVPDDAPLEYLGPFACGIMTGAGAVINTLRPTPGTSIAVFGAGAVGLSAIMAARVAGCTTIIAVDLKKSRLDLALEVGATHVINAGEGNVPERIRELTNNRGVHYSLESSGVPAVMTTAFDSLAENGICCITGAPAVGTRFDLDIWHLLKGRTVVGSIMGDCVPSLFIPRLIELFQQGRFPVDKMVKFYDFADINQAVTDALSGDTIKAILRMEK